MLGGEALLCTRLAKDQKPWHSITPLCELSDVYAVRQ